MLLVGSLSSATFDLVVVRGTATEDLVGVFAATTIGFVGDFTIGAFFTGILLATGTGRLTRSVVALLVRGVNSVGVAAEANLDDNLKDFGGVVIVIDLDVNLTFGDEGTATDFEAFDGVGTATDLADCLGVVVGVVVLIDLDDNLYTFGGVAAETSVLFLISGVNTADFCTLSRLLFLTGDATDGDEDDEVMER